MAELEHGMNCEGNIPQRENDCTCGLKWRIMLQTEQEMHNAWRKRAEEAEKAISEEIEHANTLFDALCDLLDLHEDEPQRPAVAYALGVWNDHKLRRKELP